MFSDTRKLTIGYVCAVLADQYGDQEAVAFLESGQRITYSELHSRSNRVAQGLLEAGVTKGTHVALLLDNSPEIVLTYLALAKIGAVAVPVNTAARGAMLQYYLQHSDSTVLIASSELLPLIGGTIETCEMIELVVTVNSSIEPGSTCPTGKRVLRFDDLIRHTDAEIASGVNYKDLALLMFTSGTTGPSKANMFSHAHTVWYALEQRHYHRITSSDVMYVTLPFFHANGLLSSLLATLLSGGRVAVARRFSATRFWQDIAASKATVVGLLGSMSNIILKQPERDSDRLNSLRAVVMIPAGDSAVEFSKRFGARIYSGYGLTDYALAAAYNEDCPVEKIGTAGRARENVEIRIVDDDDMDLPPGVSGEIVLRSREPWRTSSGYYKMPEKYIEAIRNGWFHTGDLGYLDPEGFLYFTGRKKEAIRRRGENISTYEAEQIICAHPGVAEAAVFGVPSSMSEDEVVAAVVLRDGVQLSPEALADYCLENMPYFMVPRFVRFSEDLPRNLSLKVVKGELAQDARTNLHTYSDVESYITQKRAAAGAGARVSRT